MPEHTGAVFIAGMLGLVPTFAEPDLASLQMVGSQAHDLPPLLSAMLNEKRFFLLTFVAVGVCIEERGTTAVRFEDKALVLAATNVDKVDTRLNGLVGKGQLSQRRYGQQHERE